MTKSYLAARAVLSGATSCPPGVDARIFRMLQARHKQGELWLDHATPMVWRSERSARIADALAEGTDPDDLAVAGYLSREIATVRNAWANRGCPRLTDDHQSATPDDNTTDGLDGLRQLVQMLNGALSTPEGTQSLAQGVSDAIDRLGVFDLPNFYLSVRRDRDQNQPWELSFGATMRKKSP